MAKTIVEMLDEMDQKLADTLEEAKVGRGPMNDMAKVIMPIFQEQNQILRALLAEVGKKEPM